MSIRALLVLFMILAFGSYSYAQDKAEAQSADDYLREQTDVPALNKAKETVPAEAPKEESKPEVVATPKPVESPDMVARKIELAKKMHQIRTTRDQVDSAIMQASMGMPETERAPFVAAMKSVLNYNAIEKISVDAMVETFTLSELEAMVAYHTTPEAQSISQKMPQWAKAVQPEVVRMIDSAMMRVRTGASP